MENDGVAFGALDLRFVGRQRTDGPAQPGLEIGSLGDAEEWEAAIWIPPWANDVGKPGERWNTRFLGT